MNSKLTLVGMLAVFVLSSSLVLAQGFPADALSTPPRPVTGRWNVNVVCPTGGQFHLSGARFIGGRYAQGNVNSQQHTFTVDLAMGYAGNAQSDLKITGVAGGPIALLGFQATNRGMPSPRDFRGPGTWGSAACSADAQFVGPDIPEPLMEPGNATSGLWDLSVKCPGNAQFSVNKERFIGGRAALGFDHGIEEFSLQHNAANNSIHLGGYVLWSEGGVATIDVSATQQPPDRVEGTPYVGSGRYGAVQNCTFLARSHGQ